MEESEAENAWFELVNLFCQIGISYW
jgi:hypothetical protein